MKPSAALALKRIAAREAMERFRTTDVRSITVYAARNQGAETGGGASDSGTKAPQPI
jgi:hypothetical protein